MPEQLLDSSEVDVLPDEDARKGMTECVPGAVGDACSGQGTQVTSGSFLTPSGPNAIAR